MKFEIGRIVSIKAWILPILNMYGDILFKRNRAFYYLFLFLLLLVVSVFHLLRPVFGSQHAGNPRATAAWKWRDFEFYGFVFSRGLEWFVRRRFWPVESVWAASRCRSFPPIWKPTRDIFLWSFMWDLWRTVSGKPERRGHYGSQCEHISGEFPMFNVPSFPVVPNSGQN